MIGMILPVKKINRLLNDTEEHENFQFYFQLAEEFEVDLLIYSLKRLDIQQLKVEGYLYSYKDKKLDKEIVDLPKVNFFRIVLGKLESYQMLKEIEENHQVTFINLVPPRDKYKIYQYLSEKEDFAKFVPESVPLTYKSLEHFLKKYKKVIVKPFSGALGEKISLIQKLEPFYYISYIHKKRQYNRPIYPRQLYSFYKKYFNNDRYMIQPWIDFKKNR